jgi:hypothetical protein
MSLTLLLQMVDNLYHRHHFHDYMVIDKMLLLFQKMKKRMDHNLLLDMNVKFHHLQLMMILLDLLPLKRGYNVMKMMSTMKKLVKADIGYYYFHFQSDNQIFQHFHFDMMTFF